MSSGLYVYDNYTSHYSNIINSEIRCYDIKQANINILLDYDIITQEVYDNLRSMRKIDREIYVGNLCKDKEISSTLSHGFIDARKALFEFNNIEDHEILSIKKDAVYTIEKVLQYTTFRHVNFRLTDTYSSFYKVKGLELYYNGKDNILHVKGIGDDTIENYHKNHFFLLLKTIFRMAEQQDLLTVLTSLQSLINIYLNYELEPECYREFNRISAYRIKYNNVKLSKSNNDIGLYCLSDDMLYNFRDVIDISYNYQILIDLYGYYFERYMNGR